MSIESFQHNGVLSRRSMLQRTAAGFGGLALASLLADQSRGANPLAAAIEERLPHFAPKAKRVIFLFMFGGPSAHDLFLHKPKLDRDHGKPNPVDEPRIVFARTGKLMKSPWKRTRHGESGHWISELLPEISTVADELCFIKSMYGTPPEHGAASLMMHTGSSQFVRPSIGSWVSYGLGTENENLPAFLTICPPLASGGAQNYSSAFLPAANQGTRLGTAQMGDMREARFEFLENPHTPREVQLRQLHLIQKWQRDKLARTVENSALEARIRSFELAFRMQTEAPQLLDISKESKATQELYGLNEENTRNFGMRCLLARRFSEQGVRFVQATHGESQKWDHHENLRRDLPKSCREIDRPVAGLIKDLKSRGLLEETLVLWGGEFGRTAAVELDRAGNPGRDHNPNGFTMFMAGGGVKPGFSHGETDDYGYYAVEDKVHLHDLHATILHLLGLDHERLTYRHQGRDFRLTDVYGNVVHEIIA